jgi:hypothetical protein
VYHLAPVFPVHVASWWVSNCGHRSGLLTHTVLVTVGKCPAFLPTSAHVLAKGPPWELSYVWAQLAV